MEAHTETARRARPSSRATLQPQRPPRNAAEVWALVPLKDLSLGKTRLAGVLDAKARRGLALAMARDVTRALTRAGGVARVVMVSDIPGLPGLLGLDDVSCFDTGGARGLNEDLSRAAEWAQAQGAGQVLIVHADLPHLTAAGIDRFIAAATSPRRLRAAADKEGSGTNLLLAPLPLPLPLVFGSRSLPRFHHAAMEAGIGLEVRHDPALAGDIDEAEDLNRLMATYRRGYLAGRATAAWLAATLEVRA
ncbi:2-phospho-L-lactate guanylyltransferase [Denitratisoma sp. DHT3]|uniref:2-phospho-L-lactate guanylyltransferase n=1 Tax=Denitratisoma sp. DHT3 TaxID=1981880 RepID=UPI001647D277|nr:2-phospho-L-lactate guanylyltransferase [Denitratisoma sp. DHT3]